jgi:hypothetical protein
MSTARGDELPGPAASNGWRPLDAPPAYQPSVTSSPTAIPLLQQPPNPAAAGYPADSYPAPAADAPADIPSGIPYSSAFPPDGVAGAPPYGYTYGEQDPYASYPPPYPATDYPGEWSTPEVPGYPYGYYPTPAYGYPNPYQEETAPAYAPDGVAPEYAYPPGYADGYGGDGYGQEYPGPAGLAPGYTPDYYPGDYYPGDYYPGDYYPGDYYPGDYYPGNQGGYATPPAQQLQSIPGYAPWIQPAYPQGGEYPAGGEPGYPGYAQPPSRPPEQRQPQPSPAQSPTRPTANDRQQNAWRPPSRGDSPVPPAPAQGGAYTVNGAPAVFRPWSDPLPAR